MIQIPAQARVFVMHEPVSFRKGIDGMAGVARVVLQQEPMSGALFVFRNRRRQMLRILFYDGGVMGRTAQGGDQTLHDVGIGLRLGLRGELLLRGDWGHGLTDGKNALTAGIGQVF